MSTDLEPRIRELFRDLADQTTITPDVHPSIVSQRQPSSGRWSYALAAAVTVTLIAGVIVVQTRRDRSEPASTVHEYGDPVGIFPAGDVDRVVAVAYGSPSDVAAAYLVDRFPATDAEMSSALLNPPLYDSTGDRAVLLFEAVPNESVSTGRLTMLRVEDPPGDAGWVVVSADIGGAQLGGLELDDGRIVGTVTTDVVGRGLLSVHDAESGDLIDEETTDIPDGTTLGEPEVIGFEVGDVSARAVSVRFWNPATTEESGPVFAESLVREGDVSTPSTSEQWSSVTDDLALGPFATDSNSLIESLTGRQEIVRARGVSVAITDGYQGGPPDPAMAGGLCLATTMGGTGRSLCWWPDGTGTSIATSTLFVETNEPNVGIIASVVPDTVASVTDSAGRNIPINDNVWYAVVGAGLHTYFLESADGRKQQVLTYGIVPMGSAPG